MSSAKGSRTDKSKPRRSKAPKDPHADREAARYENPIPSREVILGVLEAADGPQSFGQIRDQLHLEGEEPEEALRRRLGAMTRDGQLMQNRAGRFGLASKMDLQTCRVIGHRDGYGFAKPDGGGDDLFLSSRQMQLVFDGDRILAATTGYDNRGRPEGKVVEVLERAHTEVVGRYIEESGIGYLVPHNTRISQQILIPPNCKGSARKGQVVSVELTDYPTPVLGAKGKVLEVLGDHLDPGLEIDVAIRAHGIPFEWPEEVLDEVALLREEPDDGDKVPRVDLRAKPFVTIDGEDARDFDDAVYCEPEPGGFRLWVAIADVSHYVSVGSALDAEAANRGNSVYFPERVVPMLPEVLSNGLCSLKPMVDRLVMVCELAISGDGELEDYCFYEGVIHSHARLTYTQVATVLDQGWCDGVAADRIPDLLNLHALYRVLRAARDRRGAIDFDTTETRIIFNEARKIEAIVPVVRNDAHKLIEECMLAANVATAQLLEQLGYPALYRVHEGPSADRLENLRSFLGELALDLPGGESPTPSHYQQVLSQLEGREDAAVIQTMMLRSLSQAVYQPENGGHFGLHYPAYAHFTSPIRRYPDLLVHRAIRSALRDGKQRPHLAPVAGADRLSRRVIYPYTEADMAALGEACSVTERRADDATREVEAWLKCEFLRHKVGEVFEGVVSSVTGFGIFVELGDLFIEGLVHISALPGDYYHFDPAHQRLVGERTRQVFQLGTVVTVQVARVDLETRKIDLELEGAAPRRQSGDAAGAPAEGRGRSAVADQPAQGKGKKSGGRRRAGGKAGSPRKGKPR